VNEHSFIDAVHRLLPTDPFIKWKIHDIYTGGKPDAYYCGPASDLWIEYKYLPALPKRPTTAIKIDISLIQIDWLSRLAAFGRPVWVVVGSPKQAVILTIEEALGPITQAEYLRRAITFRELGSRIKEHCGCK